MCFQVMEELSLASEGKAVEEYVAVVCFLVREGADWDIEAKSGVCPHQALSPQAVTLISDYVKNQLVYGINYLLSGQLFT